MKIVFETSMDSAQRFSKKQEKCQELLRVRTKQKTSLCHCIYYTHMMNNADSSTSSISKKNVELFEKLQRTTRWIINMERH